MIAHIHCIIITAMLLQTPLGVYCNCSSHSFNHMHTTWSIFNYTEGRVKCHCKFVADHHLTIIIMSIYSFIISSIIPASVSIGLLHSTGCGLSVADHITSGTSHYCNCVCSGEKDKTSLSWHETVSKLIISRNTDYCFIFIVSYLLTIVSYVKKNSWKHLCIIWHTHITYQVSSSYMPSEHCVHFI